MCEDIEKSIKNNDPATAVSIIRCLKGGNRKIENTPVHDKSGKLLINSKDTPKRWREFFFGSLNVFSPIDPNLIGQIQTPPCSALEENRQNAQLSIEEVRRAVSQMKSRKAPGSDEVSVDILKFGGEIVIRWLVSIFTDMWQNEHVVQDWSVTTLISI